MFGKRFELFKLLGFSVKVDLSWIVIAVLVTWSLAAHVFPNYLPDLSPATYWTMGVAGMIGLFVSIVLHELSHSLAARRYGLPMKGITLFIFGGVAEMDREPPSAKAEFMMAIAGPLASVVIAVACFGLAVAGQGVGLPDPINGVFGYLAFLNGVLVAFNIIPAFPLDGGRVLRSALWQWKGSLRWATRITSEIGSGFGIVLILLGVFAFIGGNFVGGMWYALLGMFLRGAAQSSYQQVLIRRALEGEPLRRFMNAEPITVAPDLTVDRLVEDYVYRHHFKMYPVVEDGKLVGCVTTRQIKEVPREQWSSKTIREIVEPCSETNTISPETDAMHALTRMNRTQTSRAMVVQNGHLEGVIALKT